MVGLIMSSDASNTYVPIDNSEVCELEHPTIENENQDYNQINVNFFS